MEITIFLLTVLILTCVIAIMEYNYGHALSKKTIDTASVETLGKTYSLELDYTVFPKTNQILKNENTGDEIINASRRTPIRGTFNSPDQDSISDFDAFLIKENRIAVNYENGTIGFNNQHHLVNLECNFNTTDDGCHTFYGEFPYRDEPTEYMLVLAAYHKDYVKYYVAKTNLG